MKVLQSDDNYFKKDGKIDILWRILQIKPWHQKWKFSPTYYVIYYMFTIIKMSLILKLETLYFIRKHCWETYIIK